MVGRVEPRRTKPLAGAIIMIGVLGLAACGGGDDDDNAIEGAQIAPVTTASTSTVPTPGTTPATTTTTTTPITIPAPDATIPPSTSAALPVRNTATTIGSLITAPPTTAAPRTQPAAPVAPPVDAYAAEPIIEIGSISIPKIGVDMTMYEGIRLTTLDYGPGHWPGTAMPGEPGNVVVGGHRTSKHRVFRNVDQLVAGDEIIFNDADGTFTYIVNRVEVVEPDAVWIVNPTATPQATLFACHPPGSTRQRIVVFADLQG